jgi:polysaccharide biosynthesis protein PslH
VEVLLVSPWFPSPPFGGALIRVFETVRHLARRYQVTLLAPIDRVPSSDDTAALEELGAEVLPVRVAERGPAVAARLAEGLVRRMPFIQGLHYDRALAARVAKLTSQRRFDVVHVEHSFMAPYVDHVRTASSRLILSMHNVESRRFRREMRVMPWSLRRVALAADAALFGSWERRAVRRFDGIAVVSPDERAWVLQHAPGATVAVVPNGVDAERFTPSPIPVGSNHVVFPGLMNYPPNEDAALWFCDTVLPLIARRFPNVHFTIVGDKPTAAVRRLGERAGIEITGRVADVRPYLERAAAVVVPLRSGAGTRLKILEALAMRRPVVSTSVGAEGLDFGSGGVLVGDSPEQFADQVCTLIGNPLVGDRLGRAGRRVVENTYDWRICFRALDNLYERVCALDAAHSVAVNEAVQ